MTQDSQIREFQDHARRSLQSGQAAPALALLTQANVLEPNSPSTLMLQGIALSRMNQPAAASDAFRQAIAVAPNDGKILFNYAIHLYSYGERQEALAAVQSALKANPEHAGSLELAGKIERDLGLGPGFIRASTPHQPPPQYRGGYEAQEVHTIPLLGRISIAWTCFGWFLAIVSAGVLILFVAILAQSSQAPGGYGDALSAGPLSGVLKITYMISLLATIFFSVMDLLDRRGNWTWLVPLVLLSFVGLGWIGLPLYLLSERKST
jgi:tetratricopeptide (TPR) repeat protein